MNELEVIKNTASPLSKKDLIKDLKTLGIKETDNIILHVSLSKIGWIIGAEVTFLDAIQNVLKKGTLVMATQTGQISDPTYWENPPVPKTWLPKIIEHMPAYNKDVTPTFRLGRVAKLFHRSKDVYRTNHPLNSFAAWGKYAKELSLICDYSNAFGTSSPVKFMIDHQFKILQIGVDYDTTTVLHYAETQLSNAKTKTQKVFVIENNQRRVIDITDIDYSVEHFIDIGNAYEKKHFIKKGLIGQAKSKIIDVPSLITFGINYLNEIK